MAGQPLKKLKDKLPTNWQELDEVFEELDVTPRMIIAGILHIAQNGSTDKDKLKAWDMLAKLTGIKPPERVFVTGYEALELTWKERESA